MPPPTPRCSSAEFGFTAESGGRRRPGIPRRRPRADRRQYERRSAGDATPMTDALKRLSDEGVAIWLDDLSRKRITSGNLAELIDQQHVVGVTTNPSIFQKAISAAATATSSSSPTSPPAGHRRGGRPHDHHGRRPGRRRHPAPGLRRHRRPGRPGLHRGRPAPRARHHGRPIAEAKQLAWLVDRPEHPDQDPGDQGGPARRSPRSSAWASASTSR